jgi:two-component system chemotaxis sensor kinase CheA
MRLIYKFLIPIILSLALIFTLLHEQFIASEKEVITSLKSNSDKLLLSQLEKREQAQLENQKEYMDFVASMVANVAMQYVYNYEEESLKKPIATFLKIESIKAVEIFDFAADEVFMTCYKEENRTLYDKLFPTSLELSKKMVVQKTMLKESSGDSERVGYIKLYYDNKRIAQEIENTKKLSLDELELFSKAIDEKIANAIHDQNMLIISAALAVVLLILLLSSLFVLKPLAQVKKGIDGFFDFLQGKTDNTATIELNSGDEFGEMSRSINENISVSARLHEEIHQLNHNLEEKIEEKTQKISTLLHNADQGFLSFGEDFIIDKEYSQACLAFFQDKSEDIASQDIAALLFEEEPSKQEYFKNTVHALINENTPLKRETFISLLPEELQLNQKDVHIEYKLIEEHKIMLVLTDITQKKRLEKKVEIERKVLKMVVGVVSDSESFFEIKQDYENFFKRKHFIDSKQTALNNASKLYRNIHTFKGLFAQKEMIHLVKAIHELESKLSYMIKNPHSIQNEAIEEAIQQFDYNLALQKDLAILKKVLGDDFLEFEGKISVQESSIETILNRFKNILKNNDTEQLENIYEELKFLKNKQVQALFSPFPKLVESLSKKLEKQVNPLDIICDNHLRLSDEYKPFINTLVHVFRNSMDHGIEILENRFEKEKNPIATISCIIEENGSGQLNIIIADDGAGIDLEKIKQTALERKLYTHDELEQLDRQELLQLIFENEFSTKNEVSELSGRGVGLAAVKEELEKLNGTLQIDTRKDEGTSFTFTLPIPASQNTTPVLSEENLRKNIFKPIIRRTYEFFEQEVAIPIQRTHDDICSQCSFGTCTCLDDTIYFKTFSGGLDCVFGIRYDDVLKDKLMRTLNLGTIYPEEEEELKLDTAKEIGNIIFGNAINHFPKLHQSAFLSTGITFEEPKEMQRNESNKILKSELETEFGKVTLFLISPQSVIFNR